MVAVREPYLRARNSLKRRAGTCAFTHAISKETRVFRAGVGVEVSSPDGGGAGGGGQVVSWTSKIIGGPGSSEGTYKPMTIRIAGLDALSDEDLAEMTMEVSGTEFEVERKDDGYVYLKGPSRNIPVIIVKDGKPVLCYYNTKTNSYVEAKNAPEVKDCELGTLLKWKNGLLVEDKAIVLDVYYVTKGANGSLVKTTDIKNSHPAPKIDISSMVLTSVYFNADKTQIRGNVSVVGRVTSDVCDITRGEEGKITEVTFYANPGSGNAFSANIPVSVTKADKKSDLFKPYEYAGTFTANLTNVPLNEAVSELVVVAHDKVYGYPGATKHLVDVDLTPPEDSDLIVEGTYENYTVAIAGDGYGRLRTTPNNGTYNPYLIRILGPQKMLEERFDQILMGEGPKVWDVAKGADGAYYLKMVSDDVPTILLAISTAFEHPSAPPPDPAYKKSLNFLGGFCVGFFWNGAGGMVHGVMTIGKTVLITAAKFTPQGIVYELTAGDGYKSEVKFAGRVAEVAKTITFTLHSMAQQTADAYVMAIYGDSTELRKLGEAERKALSLGAEVLAELWQQYLNSEPYDQGKGFGSAMFEIVSMLVPMAKAGKLQYFSKLEFLDALRATKFFSQGPGARVMTKIDDILCGYLKIRCFAAGTLVYTKDGLKNIEDIAIGDMVLARDAATGEQAYKRVDAVHKTVALSLFHLQFDTPNGNEDITCTATHPFYVVGRDEFVMARDLKVGDEFRLADGTTATLARTEREYAERGCFFDTYNIGVPGTDTYFVGKSGLWTHNMCTPDEQSVLGLFRAVMKGGKNNPVDEALRIANKLPDEAGRVTGAFLDDVLVSIDELHDAGKLDKHLIELGEELGEWSSKSAREALAGRKFEILKGRTLRRPDASDPKRIFDFIDDQRKYWDAWGPVPGPGRTNLTNLKSGIMKQFKDGGHAIFDLSGFSPSEQEVLLDWIIEAHETFKKNSNWPAEMVVLLDKAAL